MKPKFDKIIFLLILMLVLAAFLLVEYWTVYNRNRQHDEAKTELISLGYNVMHDNNMLIRLMRTYVVGRDESYKERYYELLNDYSSFAGRLERMHEIGLTESEEEIVDLIEDTWTWLESIEAETIKLMENGDYDEALAIIYGDEYMRADYTLVAAMQSLIHAVEERNRQTTSELNTQIQIVMVIFSAAFLCIMAALLVISKNNSKLRDLYKKQKESFEDEATMLQYIFDSLPVAVLIISPADISILYANKVIRKIFEAPVSDGTRKRSVLDFISKQQPDGRLPEDIIKDISAHEAAYFEFECVKTTGQTFYAGFASCKITFRGQPASLITIEDKTSELEHRNMLENIARQEQEANQLKSRFLATMSHEIRTPMNAILGITEILLQKEHISPETEDALGKIYDSGNLLLNIINDILDLSKIEAGKLELVPAKYDIPSLINDTVQLTRLRFSSGLVDFRLEIDPKTPLNLFGDELRIKQVLNNILSNAFKYTDKGSVVLSVMAEDMEKQDSAYNDVIMIFNISDTGCGMTREQLARLFDDYTRFNLETNRSTIGTGLGMGITKRLLNLMNGEISVKSKVKKGTTFTVRIPQKRVDALICGTMMTEKLTNLDFHSTRVIRKGGLIREYMPYGNVLIVDDVVSNIYVTNGMLLPYGLNIDTASSGFEAIDKVNAGNYYDIIFMDHMMPKLDGVETVKILREGGYTGTIVALTANALVGQAEMFLDNGFDGYISKPIDSRELNHMLNEFIRNKKPMDVVRAARSEYARKQEQAAIHKNANKKIVINMKKTNHEEDTATGNVSEEITKDKQKKKKKITKLEEFFLLDAQSAISTIEEIVSKKGTITDEQFHSYEIAAHGLKSALRNIGKNKLSKKAYALETAAREKNGKKLIDDTGVFLNKLNSAVDKIKDRSKK